MPDIAQWWNSGPIVRGPAPPTKGVDIDEWWNEPVVKQESRPEQTEADLRRMVQEAQEPLSGVVGWLEQTGGETLPGLAARGITAAIYGPGMEAPRGDFGYAGNLTSGIVSLAADPTMYGPHGLVRLGTKAAEKAVGEVAGRTLAKRLIARGVEAGTTFAAIEATHDPFRQYVETGDVKWLDVARKSAKSALLGTAMGPAGVFGKAAIPAEIAIGTVGAAALEGRLPTAKDLGDWTAMVVGFRLMGVIGKKGMDLLLRDYRERVAAGQEDPIPNAEVRREAGIPGATRKETGYVVEEGIRQEEVDIPGTTRTETGYVVELGYPQEEAEPTGPARRPGGRVGRMRAMQERADAEAIRGDQGQLRPEGVQPQARAEVGRHELQRPPKEGAAARYGEAPREVVVLEPPVGAKPPTIPGLAALTKKLRAAYKQYRGIIEPEHPQDRMTQEAAFDAFNMEVPQAGFYVFRYPDQGEAEALRRRLPNHLRWRVKSVKPGHKLYSGANGADVLAAIGTDAMAQSIIEHAAAGQRGTIQKLLEFARNPANARQLDPETIKAIRQYEQLVEGKGETETIQGRDLEPGDTVRIAGEELTATEKDAKGTWLKDDSWMQVADNEKLRIEEGSHRPGAGLPPEVEAPEDASFEYGANVPKEPKRPGLEGQETFDALTGAQETLPMGEPPEPPIKDVAGQEKMDFGAVEPERRAGGRPHATPESKLMSKYRGAQGARVGAAYAPSRPQAARATEPSQRPSGEPAEATVGPPGGAKVTFRPVDMPELIELAEAILGQRPRIARRLRANLGLFKGKEGNPLADILINPNAAVTPELLAQVLSHELGHAADFYPHLTLRRGNILGRIASLRNYLLKHLEAYPGAPGPLTPEDRKRIADEVRRLKTETVEREVDEVIERTTGLTPKDILAIWNACADVPVNKELEAFIKTLNRREMKSIIAQAIKGVMPDNLKRFATVVREKTGRKIRITEKVVKDVQEEIRKRVQEEIAKRKLFRDQEVREELIGLSAWWSGPFDPKTDYGKYRSRSRELYAEAISVLLRAPAELKARAPEFWRGFTAYLDRKAKLRDELLVLMQRLGGRPEDVARHRKNRLDVMFESAEEKILAVDTAMEAARTSTYADIMELLFGHLVDRHVPLMRGARKAIKLGRKTGNAELIAKAENAVYIMDEMNNIDRDIRAAMLKLDREVLQPLAADGINEADIREYLTMHRIVEPAPPDEPGGDRWRIANPLGFDPKTAGEQIAAMRHRLGREGFARLEEGMQRWHNQVFAIAQRAMEVGIISQKTFREVIVPNRHNYSTWGVVKYYEGKIPAGIRKQIGTFDDIFNPMTATVMKLISLGRMIRLNEAKHTAIEFLRVLPDSNVKRVDIPHGQREPTKPPMPGRDYLLVMRDGKMEAYDVPQNWARMFQSHDVGSASLIGKMISSPMYHIFHPMWVTFNHGFAIANMLFRDPKRTFANLPGAVKLHAPGYRVTWRQMIVSYLRAAPTAWRRAWGVDDATIRRMEQEGTLKALWTKASARNFGIAETKLERLLAEWNVTQPEKVQSRIPWIVRALYRSAEGMGVFGETWTNVAACDVMERAGIPLEKRRYIVKKYPGTPDVSQRGWANPVTNACLAYWKVRVNMLQTDARLATSSASAADWWMRRTVLTFIPAVATFLAARGLFGHYLQALFEDIPDEAKQSGSPWPVGRNDDGKVMYINDIQDDTGRFLHSLVWHGLNAMFPAGDKLAGKRLESAVRDIYAYLVPGLNPVLEMGRVWGSYAIGMNPYDPFLGRRLLNQTEEKAGGWAATRKILYWTSNQFGVLSTASYFVRRQIRGPMVEETDEGVIEILSKAAVGLQRVFKISDRGRREGYWAALENEDQEGAQFLLSLPISVRQMTARRYLLNRLGVQKILPEDQYERHLLNWWYERVYSPYTQAIRNAQEGGKADEADALRQKLDETSRGMMQDLIRAVRGERKAG